MPRQVEGRRYITVAIDTAVADWLAEYAKERNVGREHVVETALIQMRERVTRE